MNMLVVCNPSPGEAEKSRFLGLASLAHLVNSRSERDSIQKQNKRSRIIPKKNQKQRKAKVDDDEKAHLKLSSSLHIRSTYIYE